MDRNKVGLLLLMLLSISFTLQAQVHRFAVHFTDKNESPYSVDRPAEFLSQRAIDRREKQEIAVTVRDLPVNPAYLSGISEKGVNVFYSSRWLNAALIEADSSVLSELSALSYVKSIFLAAPGSKLQQVTEQNSQQSNAEVYQRVSTSSLYNTSSQLSMLGADHMHDEGYSGEDILIAVCDGGFAGVNQLAFFNHLRANDRIVATRDFTRNQEDVYQYSSHGTKALSCIAANDSENLIGTAYDASFLLMVTEDVSTEYRIEEYNWVFAVEFADSAGADIINTSLGYSTFDDPDMNYSYQDMDGNTTIISQGADMAAQAGMVVVASAGNEGNNSWYYISAPADGDSVLSVGAVNAYYQKASFSSFGPTSDQQIKPDVCALGVATVVGGPSGEVEISNGTSFAAPLITGLAAITWQKYPDLTNMEVLELLRQAGHTAEDPNTEIGYGVPNFYRDENDILLSATASNLNEFSLFPNPVKEGKVFLKSTGETREIQVVLYNTTGQSFVVEPEPIDSHIVRLDISDLKPGMYFLKVKTQRGSQTIQVMKF